MVEIAVLGLSCFLNIILGLVVYLKNPGSATHRLFLFLTSSFVLWSLASYFSVHPFAFAQITWVRLVLATAALLCFAAYLTFVTFPSASLRVGRAVKIAFFYMLFVAGLTLATPLIFTLNDEGKPAPGPGIPLFSLLIIAFVGGGIVSLVKKYRRSKGKQKHQVRLVLLGLAGTFGLIFLTNFLLVVAFNITSLIPLGPSFTLVFTGALAYAIIKHRLFDIRWIIARSLAYFLLISTLVTIYIAVVFGMTAAWTAQESVFTQQVMPLVTALFLVASAPHFKRLFDHITNKFFYRDAYDPQRFLDQLNKTVVSNIELGILLRRATNVIQENLKCEISFVVVGKTDQTPLRLIGAEKPELKTKDLQYILGEIPAISEKLIVTDSLGPGHARLKGILNANKIAVISAPSDFEPGKPALAYLVLGQKKSGNLYSHQDLQIVELVTDELMIAIQNALRFEEIQNFNVNLQSRINEATLKLRRTNNKLQVLDQTKDEFISMASHQLRTPLTSIKGYLDMVLEGDAGEISPEQRKMLEQAFISSQRMTYLISDLLNVSRLKTGKFIIEKNPVNLAAVVQEEVDQLIESAKMRNLTLAYKRPHNFPSVMLDETKIRQVIMNFLDNAIYYTRNGGKIEIALAEQEHSIELTITDSGIGVPKGEQHRLFTKFYRAPNAKQARPDGTGLGLFMAKKVVIAQGGAIIFSSQEGKGSTFGFSFPKKKLAIQAPLKTHN